MHLDFTAEQDALRRELRAYFTALMTPDVLARLAGDDHEASREVVRRIGADGWLGVGWPTEYGGQGRSAMEQYLFFEEAQRAEAPIPLIALNTVGPAIMAFGTDAQKRQFLPAILRGEVYIAVGYSEPEAGTDLASVRTRAELDGDEWVINGQKMWTTGAEQADFIWLAARTDPNAPKHKGITMFLVPSDVPGIKIAAVQTMVGHRTNATFYDDVRVPVSAVVGDVNGGWSLITTQLNFERSAVVGTALVEKLLDQTAAWAVDHGRMAEHWVPTVFARVRALMDALRIMNWRVAWSITNSSFDAAAASAVKVYGTEAVIEAYRLLLEVIGPAGAIKEGSPGAVLHGRLERQYRRAILTTFGAGVNEIQRDIIAMLALKMPPSPR